MPHEILLTAILVSLPANAAEERGKQMKFIGKYLLRHPGRFLLSCLLASSFALAELGIPTIFGWMTDAGIEASSRSVLQTGLWLMLGAAILTTAGMLGLAVNSNALSTQMVYEMRQDLFEHVMTFSMPELEKFTISSLITRTSSDAFQIQQFLNNALRGSLMAPVMMIVSIILTLMTSVPLAAIVFSTIPFILGGMIWVFKVTKPLSQKAQESTDAINQILRDDLSGVRVVRSFNRQKTEEKRFAKENAVFTALNKKLFKITMLTDPLFFLLMNLANLAIYFLAAVMISRDQMQIGQLIVFSEYLFHCMMSVLVVCSILMQVPRVAVCANRMQEVIEQKPVLGQSGTEIMGPIETLEFDNVSFHYPDARAANLEGVSFQARRGQKIAVVGATGSGKSTLVRLLCRFYDPGSGSIRINGKDLRDYDPKSFHQHAALISQKAHLFSGTIEDNITFGNPDASKEQIEKAMEISQSAHFIAQKPGGLQEMVSEEGTNLSGGQKQRISIARALASGADLLIFDDSFSALDLQTDARVREALRPLQKDALFVIIAQRISTILDADLILLMDQGRIAAAGTHQELYESSALYREIVSSQMSEQEAGIHG